MTDPNDLPYRPFELRQWADLVLSKFYPNLAGSYRQETFLLEQQNDFLWTIINNSHNISVLCLDRDYCYLFFNYLHARRMKETLGVDIQLGESLLSYLAGEDNFNQIKHFIDRGLAGETVTDIRAYDDTSLVKAYYENTYSPFLTEPGKIVGVIVASSDVTIAKEKEAKLKQAHEELEERVAKRTAELQQTTEELRGQISERGQYEQTIRENEERFRSTFEQSATAIVLTDQALCIQHGNQAFSQLTGYELDEVVGVPLSNLLGISEDNIAPFWQQQPLDPGRVWQTEMVMERKDGRSNDVSMGVTAVYDAEGELLEYVVQLSNISLRRQLERAQQQFITNTSHELRTPLTNIRLYLQLLEKRPENQPKYLQVLNREVGRLQTLLGDIMEITSLTAGGGASSWQVVSPEAVLEAAVNPFRRKAETKGLNLRFPPIEEGVPPINGDPARLRQALGEIIENAVNFTPTGGNIIVTIDKLQIEERHWVTMSIQDSGPGIPADEQAYVFERFFRGAMSEGGNIPGTGLGLSIAQAIIKAHGGRISVESLIGWGSIFTVLLPVNQ
jgi:PAS domain S-box-containing protein